MAKNHVPSNKAGHNDASLTRLIFALVMIAVFLDVVDFSVVTVALPSMRAQFMVSLGDIQWVIGAYGITMAGLLLLSGRAGDIYGQKELFIFGVLLFTITSFTGGIAPSLLILIASRAIQGIGAAITSVTAFAIFVRLFPEGKERNKAMGVFIAVISAGFAAGAVVGGILTSVFGWRSVLFINVPIGLVTAVLIQKFLPSEKGRSEVTSMDLPGAITITSGLILLVYALTVVSNGSFSLLQVLLPLGLAVLLLVGFFVIESKAKAPLMPLNFLKRGIVLKANVLTLILGSAAGGFGVIIATYLQQILGFPPFLTGLALLPAAAIFFFVGGWGTSWFIEKLGIRQVLIISSSLVMVGLLLLALISVQMSYLIIIPGMVIWALGASIGFPALSIAAISGTKRGEEGLASGLVSTSMRMGFPIGLAVMLAVASATDPVSSTAAISSAATLGFSYSFIAAALLTLVGIAIAFTIKIDKPLKEDRGIDVEFRETGLA